MAVDGKSPNKSCHCLLCYGKYHRFDTLPSSRNSLLAWFVLRGSAPTAILLHVHRRQFVYRLPLCSRLQRCSLPGIAFRGVLLVDPSSHLGACAVFSKRFTGMSRIHGHARTMQSQPRLTVLTNALNWCEAGSHNRM